MVGLDIKKGQQDTDRLDHVSVALSVLLFVSPWLLGYADQTLAATTAWVSAVFIAATSLAACIRFAKWEEWLIFSAGIWLVMAPWALDFVRFTGALAAFIGIGCLVASIAGAEIWGETHPGRQG